MMSQMRLASSGKKKDACFFLSELPRLAVHLSRLNTTFSTYTCQVRYLYLLMHTTVNDI